MAKPSTNNSASVLVDNQETPEGLSWTNNQVDSESKIPYTKVVRKVFIQSLHDARLVYTGQVTGQQYIWNTAGSIVEVDTEDSILLLAKRIYGTCCGNSKDGTAIFRIAV